MMAILDLIEFTDEERQAVLDSNARKLLASPPLPAPGSQ
jgi:hypothetical protein